MMSFHQLPNLQKVTLYHLVSLKHMPTGIARSVLCRNSAQGDSQNGGTEAAIDGLAQKRPLPQAYRCASLSASTYQFFLRSGDDVHFSVKGFGGPMNLAARLFLALSIAPLAVAQNQFSTDVLAMNPLGF